MMPRITFWPLNLIRDRANAAIEFTISPRPTVITEIMIELIMKVANGTRPKTPR